MPLPQATTARAFVDGTMCVDAGVYERHRDKIVDAHEFVGSKIAKFLPEPPPKNDDGKYLYPPDALRVALEYLTKLGVEPPVKEEKASPGKTGKKR